MFNKKICLFLKTEMLDLIRWRHFACDAIVVKVPLAFTSFLNNNNNTKSADSLKCRMNIIDLFKTAYNISSYSIVSSSYLVKVLLFYQLSN